MVSSNFLIKSFFSVFVDWDLGNNRFFQCVSIRIKRHKYLQVSNLSYCLIHLSKFWEFFRQYSALGRGTVLMFQSDLFQQLLCLIRNDTKGNQPKLKSQNVEKVQKGKFCLFWDEGGVLIFPSSAKANPQLGWVALFSL